RHETRRPKQAARDVHHVCALGRLRRDRNLESRVKELLAHGGGPKLFRIFAYNGLELGNRAGRDVERTADLNFASVNLHVKSERMAKLISAARPPGDAFLYRRAHRANFTVKKIDAMAPDFEPSSPVHSRPPFTERSYQTICVTIVQFPGSRSQRCRRERIRAVVINSQVDVRSFVGRAARA